MKVLVLSCSTGEGHNSAAKAMYEAFINHNVECEFLDVFSFGNKMITQAIKNSFNTIAVKTPKVFGSMYKAGDLISSNKHKSPVYFANALYANNLGKYINDHKIDVVVSSHLFPMEALTYLKKSKKIKAKLYGISTDYTCIPFLEETSLDYIFIPHESLLSEFINKKISKKKLIPLGIPVSSKFKNHLSQQEARKTLKLPFNKKIILIMTGGVGCGNIINMCDQLLHYASKDILLLVLVGKNKALYNDISINYENNKQVKAIKFTSKVEIYMDASNILLTKPGGLSSTEAVVKKIPIIHTFPIPGCETKNAQFFSKLGMSYVAKDETDLVIKTYLLLNNYEEQREMLKNQEKINDKAAQDIVDFILSFDK